MRCPIRRRARATTADEQHRLLVARRHPRRAPRVPICARLSRCHRLRFFDRKLMGRDFDCEVVHLRGDGRGWRLAGVER
jgi:hypothetical protein